MLFEYFSGNYVWNLGLNIALSCGARIGEVEEASRGLMEAAGDAGTERFLASWSALADRLVDGAGADEARGRRLSAAEKLGRAAVYYMTAERLQRHGAPGRDAISPGCGRRSTAPSRSAATPPDGSRCPTVTGSSPGYSTRRRRAAPRHA